MAERAGPKTTLAAWAALTLVSGTILMLIGWAIWWVIA